MKMNDKTITVGMIGAGLRSLLARHLFANSNKLRLKSVYDPDQERAREKATALGFPDADICETSAEVTSDPDIDWVLVFSPNRFHAEHILAAFAAGKHVFSEKPLATTIEDCKAVYLAHRESGRQLATGFVLRYSPLYRKAKELIDAGAIGHILGVDANENLSVALGSYIMRNWRRKRDMAGPYLLEKCCHDLDLLNWLIGSIPSRVASFGGLDFFKPENAHLEKKYADENGKSPFTEIPDKHGVESPFTSDKDIVDNQVAILEYRNNARVMFQSVMANASHERRMYIAGTEGTMILELFSGDLTVKGIGDESTRVFSLAKGDGHGGGDPVIMSELYKTMMDDGSPKSSGREGLESAITALAIDQAKNSGEVFALEDVWSELDR